MISFDDVGIDMIRLGSCGTRGCFICGIRKIDMFCRSYAEYDGDRFIRGSGISTPMERHQWQCCCCDHFHFHLLHILGIRPPRSSR